MTCSICLPSMAMTCRRRRAKSCKTRRVCRDIDITSSLELFNRIFDCYNTRTGCLQLALGRKFPLSRNRAVIARIVGLDDRYTLRNISTFSTNNEQQ
ncbi:hypothetical protein AVEN_223380-1 [Araneus ventricosus]|uniref:Uncharacterized protein n=1 Tax=Araneus ventricosus TaxID=182803 RepID=A0A4Y2H1S3_ARAVE|nr:hypothetical protein AVEN_223380-1 [Araneus ventricosus]